MKVLSTLFLVLASFAAMTTVRATTFDWDASYATWTAAPDDGTTASKSYNSDSTNAGNDVTISISNTNTNSSWHANRPAVNNSTGDTTGGLTPRQNALQLWMDSGNATGIVVTTTFSYPHGVNNVQITLWDVDKSAGQYNDKIDQIYATTVTGQIVAATTITHGTSNAVTGTGTNSMVQGTSTATDTSSAGTVVITFSTSEAIQSVSFRWSNSDANYGAQEIGFYDIVYTPVTTPEIGSSAAALFLCGGTIAAGAGRLWWGRRFFRRT